MGMPALSTVTKWTEPKKSPVSMRHGEHSMKSTNTSPEQKAYWPKAIRVWLAHSLLQCGRSSALLIAPELADPMAKTGIIPTLVEWAIIVAVIVCPPFAVAVAYMKWVG